MKTASLIAAALLAASTFAAEEENAESFIRKTFTVAPGGKLTIRADRGSINVKTAPVEKVQIEVTREPGRGASADILKRHHLTFTQEGNDVMVQSEIEGAGKNFWNNKNNLKVKYDVTVPNRYDVNLKTSGGSISVEDLQGNARSQTSGGGLRFGKIDGPVFGRTSGGSIEVTGSTGDVDVQSSGGGIKVGSSGGNVTARTSGGSITVGEIKGAVTAETSGGGIQVNNAGGPVNAHTSGGSIRASLANQPEGECTFTTSGGSIDVKMTENIAIDLNAHTSGGSVSTDFPITVQGTMKRNELRGKLNGGGPKLTLATSGGSIHIRKL